MLARRWMRPCASARAVGHGGPDRLPRLGEVAFLAVAIDTFHAQHVRELAISTIGQNTPSRPDSFKALRALPGPALEKGTHPRRCRRGRTTRPVVMAQRLNGLPH